MYCIFPLRYWLCFKWRWLNQRPLYLYTDKRSIHYSSISEVFCHQRVIFLHCRYKWFNFNILRNSLFNINKQNILFHCYKKHLKWGDEVMKKVSPIIQCSMALSCFANYLFVTNRVQRFFQSSMTHLGEHTSKSIDHFAVC